MQESSKETNRNRAAEAERRYRNRLLDSYNTVPERKGPILFSVAADNLLAAKTAKLAPKSLVIEKTNLMHLSPVFGGRLLTDISADMVNGYIAARLNDKAAAKTVTLEVGTLRSVLRKHRLWESIRSDLELPKVDNDIGKALTAEEQSQLLNACAASQSRSLFPAVALDFNTGLRLSELRYLRWNQIDLAKRTLRVGQSKTEYGKGRIVPLNATAMAVLMQWAANFPDRKPDDYVFATEIGGGAWDLAKKRAGITCRFHDVRHTFCTILLENGVPLPVVGELMGWSPSTMIRMAKRYGHIGQAACAAAVNHLDPAGVEWLQIWVQSDETRKQTIQ